MIPKVIHYCWFGRNPLPPLAEKCIDSWKKYLPDYEIKEWNEDNFDVNAIAYTKEAYEAKKYAFVSDYARFWILYNYGGIYFDTDVEVIKPMDDLIARGAWMGYESKLSTHYINGAIAPGLGMGCSAYSEILNDLLQNYSNLHFQINGRLNLKTIVAYTTEAFIARGLEIRDGVQECCGFTIYPPDYFNPLDSKTQTIKLSKNTYSIHHYMASWGISKIHGDIIKKLKEDILFRLLPKSILKCILRYKKKKKEGYIESHFRIKSNTR